MKPSVRRRFDPPGPKPWLMLVVALAFLGFAVEFADVLSARKDARAGDAAAAPALAVASLPPVAGLVRAIGGEAWTVESLVGPGQDPHLYEPTPRQAAALGKARLFFRTGMPFEDALAARAAAKHPDLRIVTLADLQDHDYDHGYDHDEHEDSVHGWLSPLNLSVWAWTVAKELKAADPPAADGIATREAAWLDAISAEEAATTEARRRSTAKAFVAWHPAYGAWAELCGLEQIALETDGKAPGPRALAAARERIAQTGARVLLVQNEAEKERAAGFAAAAGLRVEVIPPLGDDVLDTLRALREAVFGAETR